MTTETVSKEVLQAKELLATAKSAIISMDEYNSFLNAHSVLNQELAHTDDAKEFLANPNENYELAILADRSQVAGEDGKKVTVTNSVLIHIIPSQAYLLTDPRGAEYMAKLVSQRMFARLSSNFSKYPDENLLVTLDDWLSGRASGSGASASSGELRVYLKPLVDALKKKGRAAVNGLTISTFIQASKSTADCEYLFPHAAKSWDTVLQQVKSYVLEQSGAEDSIESTIVQGWIDTRHETAGTLGDIDFSL